MGCRLTKEATMQELKGDALRQFILSSTDAEVMQYWVDLQRDKRTRGEAHYTACYDPQTGQTIAEI